MLIDPIHLATFMAMPEAAELIEAMAHIRPSATRRSLVAHAQAMAMDGGWTPPAPFAGTVLEQTTATLLPDAPRRLPNPHAEGLVATSQEGQIVERAIRGEVPHAIADDLGVKLGVVVRAMGKARREAGIVFPGDEALPKPAAKPGKVRLAVNGRRIPEPLPVPPPPYWWEDPNHAAWTNPRVLPTRVATAEGNMAGLGPLDSRAHATMTSAATRRGITLREYIAERFEILRRIEGGERVVPVALDMRIAPQEIYGLLAKVGRARMKTLLAAAATPVEAAAPAEAPTPPPEPPRPPTAVPTPTPANRERSSQAAREAAAVKWGFPDIEAYEHARHRVKELRLGGIAPALICARIGQSYGFVKNAMSYWVEHGVQWPPITIRARDDLDRPRTEAA